MAVTSKTYLHFKLRLGALVGIASFMAIPPYRLWALATLPMLVLAALLLPKRQSRFALAVAYIISGSCGFAIGEVFWHAGELGWSGIKLMFLLLLACVVAATRTLVVKPDEA